LESHRELYNAALQERRAAWARSKTRIRYGDQSAQLSEIRSERVDVAAWSFSSQQATLRRLNRAFKAFFRRVTTGQTPGYPRFKYPDTGLVYLKGIGHIKATAHRFGQGRVKTIQIRREGRRWMLILSCDDVPTNPLPGTGRQAGVDVGVARFATTSDGTYVDNPRWERAAADKLSAAQRRLQRSERRSNNQRRRRETVALRRRKVANQRRDFHHRIARQFVERYDLIAVEDLAIANMLRRVKTGRRFKSRWAIPAEWSNGEDRIEQKY
jgi:putative transposase